MDKNSKNFFIALLATVMILSLYLAYGGGYNNYINQATQPTIDDDPNW